MALTGELSDLSLAELIEFFCNQRKTGRLKVIYPVGAGYFYLKSGTVIHARFGDLRGIDAVYYALSQPNASFAFSPAFEAPEHSINQPWTSVVLEGLRRMDEGLHPPKPSVHSIEESNETVPASVVESVTTQTAVARKDESKFSHDNSANQTQPFGVLLAPSENNSFSVRRWNPAFVMGAVVALIAVVGVPWGWYKHKNAARFANEASAATANPPAPATVETADVLPTSTPQTEPESPTTADASELAKRQREVRARERAKAIEQGATNVLNNAGPRPTPAPTVSKRATVQVTYDENGRVTQASGGDATALRIARQKRFPPGKPGSATITIPIN